MNTRTRRFRYALITLAAALIMLLSAVPAFAAGSAVYDGQDYSRVYDYEYYTTITHPELAGKSKSYVLKYFVTKGIKKKEQANSAFNVVSYYNANPSLRYTYETDWKSYYLYYQTKGYKKGAVMPCAELQNPIDYYMVGSKKHSLKKIYNFAYFTQNNEAAYKYWKEQNDAGAVKYFVETGMLMGLQGNALRDRNSLPYRVLKNRIFPNFKDNEYMLADTINSTTGYLILVNQGKRMVYIFKGKRYNWEKINEFQCSIGAAGTPTTDGLWKVFLKRTYFITGGSNRCWYFTVVHGDQGFHSEIYDSSSTPSHMIQSGVGQAVSHGCMRLKLANAKWIFDHIPLKTKVKIYNCPYTKK